MGWDVSEKVGREMISQAMINKVAIRVVLLYLPANTISIAYYLGCTKPSRPYCKEEGLLGVWQ